MIILWICAEHILAQPTNPTVAHILKIYHHQWSRRWDAISWVKFGERANPGLKVCFCAITEAWYSIISAASQQGPTWEVRVPLYQGCYSAKETMIESNKANLVLCVKPFTLPLLSHFTPCLVHSDHLLWKTNILPLEFNMKPFCHGCTGSNREFAWRRPEI